MPSLPGCPGCSFCWSVVVTVVEVTEGGPSFSRICGPTLTFTPGPTLSHFDGRLDRKKLRLVSGAQCSIPSVAVTWLLFGRLSSFWSFLRSFRSGFSQATSIIADIMMGNNFSSVHYYTGR